LTAHIARYLRLKWVNPFILYLAWLDFKALNLYSLNFCTTNFESLIFYVEELSWKSKKIISNKLYAEFSFFKKLESKSRYRIEGENKILIALRWNSKSLIAIVRFF